VSCRRTSLLAEALEISPGRHAAELDLLNLAKLVDEVGVDDHALALLQQPHEPAHPPSRAFEHRHRHVHPPPVAGEVHEQLLLLTDGRNRELLE